MTALNPLKGLNIKVTGVASETYPTNRVCAHPKCTEPTESDHHIFPRGLTKSKSYFVQINDKDKGEVYSGPIVPHVVGLCGSGTTGHHGDVEEHRAWIKYEDGVFVWYDRVYGAFGGPDTKEALEIPEAWESLGTLNPQPAQSGKAKRSRFKGEQRRKRRVISIRVPDDNENGGEVWDETYERVCDKLVALGLYDDTTHIPVYEATIAAWNDWLNS